MRRMLVDPRATARPGPPRSVLAFDLATVTGWACLGVTDTGITVYRGGGSRRFIEGSQPGQLWQDVELWLESVLAQIGPSVTFLAYEKVVRHAGTIAAHRYGGLEAALLRNAYRRRMAVVPINVSSVKRRVLGKGGGKGTGKAEMMAAVEALGIDVVDDNHADAVAVGLQALDEAASMIETPEEA